MWNGVFNLVFVNGTVLELYIYLCNVMNAYPNVRRGEMDVLQATVL